MKIFIRADGGKSIGMGHVMRMLALASEFRKENEVFFICKNNESGKYKAGIDTIEKNKFKVLKINDNVNIIDEIVSMQNKYKADILITDSYDVNEEYFHILKSKFKLNGYVDDVNKCYMNVDFIINQNINAEKMDYSKTTAKGTKLFLGSKYCMLREEFKNACSQKKIKKSVEDILLTVGGMDNAGNTIKILNNLKTLKQRIHVVLGKAFDNSVIDRVYKIAKEYKNIYTYENASMSELMKKCDIAVAACGSTIYELCAMKVPAIGIILADNQIEVGKMMADNGLLSDIFCSDRFEEEKFMKSVKNLIVNKNLRNEIQKKQEFVVDINGVFNLVNEIKLLIFHM